MKMGKFSNFVEDICKDSGFRGINDEIIGITFVFEGIEISRGRWDDWYYFDDVVLLVHRPSLSSASFPRYDGFFWSKVHYLPRNLVD